MLQTKGESNLVKLTSMNGHPTAIARRGRTLKKVSPNAKNFFTFMPMKEKTGKMKQKSFIPTRFVFAVLLRRKSIVADF